MRITNELTFFLNVLRNPISYMFTPQQFKSIGVLWDNKNSDTKLNWQFKPYFGFAKYIWFLDYGTLKTRQLPPNYKGLPKNL